MTFKSLLASLLDVTAQRLRTVVPRESRAYARLQVMRMRMPTRHPASRTDRFVQAFADQYPRAFFIQIGSNDGVRMDPLRRSILTSPWSGVLVEPVPYLFAELKRNYRKRPGLVLENAAIGDYDGEREFYYLRKADDPTGLPDWYESLGSFHRDVILGHSHSAPGIERLLVSEPVACMTFDSLCRKHGVTHVDLLHTDTEGHDFSIIRQINFERLRPRVLIYEHQHLSVADRQSCHALLASHGYDSFEHILDTVCLNLLDTTARDARLLDFWRTLKLPAGAK